MGSAGRLREQMNSHVRDFRTTRRTTRALLAVSLAAWTTGAFAQNSGPTPLQSFGPYERNVPTPSMLLGYSAGERFTSLLDQERVIEAIVGRSGGRASIDYFGKSTEGRPLRIVVITSPENQKRIGAIQQDLKSLADGTLDDKVIERSPTVVWVNQAIHGDEAASFESAMWLIYNLCASRGAEVTKFLQETVVIVNPCYNPDGRERFATWAKSVARGDEDPGSFEQSEPRFVDGRTNHYRFDLNRDRISMSQVETRQEIAAFLKWHPQTYIDQHGEVETYHFAPAALSINARVDRARYHRFSEIFGRETAKAFDALGYPYYVKDIFDLYYPGYLDSWTTLSGAIGMTHETDAQMIARRDPDGHVRTLRGGMERHFTAAMGIIRAAAANRKALVRSFAEYKQKNASGAFAGNRKAFVASSPDLEPLARMQRILSTSGIRADLGFGTLNGKGTSIWSSQAEDLPSSAGYTLVVPMAQPQASLAMTLLEADSDFEKEFVDEQIRRRKSQSTAYAEGNEFYDLTGWSLPLIHGVKAWWLDRVPNVPALPSRNGMPNLATTIGWAISPDPAGTALAAKLLQAGVRVQQSPDAMKVGGKSIPAGAFLVPLVRNEAGLEKRVRDLLGADAAKLIPIDSAYPESGRMNPGSEAVSSLRAMKIGVLFGDSTSPTDFGGIWNALDNELKLPFTALSNNGLRRGIGAYSTIIAPEGADVSAASLREWVQGGGCLILLGGDPNRGGFLKLEPLNQVDDAGDLPGTLFLATMDERHFLNTGLQGRPTAALLFGDRFYKATDGGTAVRVASADRVLLSGWAWPDKSEAAVKGAAVIHGESVGRGRVVWFAVDPTDRALLAGHWGQLMNAIISGPRP